MEIDLDGRVILFCFLCSFYQLCNYHRQQNKCYPQKDFSRPFSKLRAILSVANSLAHNNIIQICYCGQILLQSAAVNCWQYATFWGGGVTFIFLVMIHRYYNM